MSVKLLTEHHLDFLSLKGYCTGTSESTLVKMPHCWKSHVAAHISFLGNIIDQDHLAYGRVIQSRFRMFSIQLVNICHLSTFSVLMATFSSAYSLCKRFGPPKCLS